MAIKNWIEAGAGWPVVLLHAFPLGPEMWRPQLDRVPEGFRFIAPELIPPEGGGYTIGGMNECAADLDAFLDSLEIDDAVIGGLSMGGYIAFAAYRRMAHRFTGLILADTRPQADTAEGRAGRGKMRELLRQGGPSAVADQMLPKLLAPETRETNRALVASVRRLIESRDSAAIDAAIVAMMGRPDSTPDLSTISCATLVAAGEHDEITPVAVAEDMQRAIRRSTLTVIPGAGHLSNLEQPEAFSRALEDFLRAHL